jgi:hypothetical protein
LVAACALLGFARTALAASVPPDAAPRPVPIDLGDSWVPRIFSETPALPQAYRATYVALANESPGDGAERATERSDRYHELFGISPSFGVLRWRLLDEERHACHAAVNDAPLVDHAGTLAGGQEATSSRRGRARAAALKVAQAHLVCDGLLAPGDAKGRFDAATEEAVGLYQRRHMLPSRPGTIDQETREAMLRPSRELDFRALLRALRERVADATGLIEDGSAANAWEPVLGRFIDSSEYRNVLRDQPLPGAVPDLVARATAVAARALGWTSPEDATAALAPSAPRTVTLLLPAAPAYHSPSMDLRVEIDRGDIRRGYSKDRAGRIRSAPVERRPTLTVFVRTPEGDVPLVRWATTIGAWQDEKIDQERVAPRYKESPVGRRYWRDLVAAPAWFPPPTTPDEELMSRRPDGRWGAYQDAVGPGYRSAYGLVALLHHRGSVTASRADDELSDATIRTHGSGNYRSILRGSSHGCHRLFNHLAIRLGDFLLAHRAFERSGLIDERYERTLHWRGRTAKLRVSGRGYRYELTPAIPVDVLPGRRVRAR